MGTMDLDSIKACFFSSESCLSELIFDHLDFFLGQFMRNFSVRWITDRGRCYVVHTGDAAMRVSACMIDLRTDFSSVGVNRIG